MIGSSSSYNQLTTSSSFDPICCDSTKNNSTKLNPVGESPSCCIQRVVLGEQQQPFVMWQPHHHPPEAGCSSPPPLVRTATSHSDMDEVFPVLQQQASSEETGYTTPIPTAPPLSTWSPPNYYNHNNKLHYYDSTPNEQATLVRPIGIFRRRADNSPTETRRVEMHEHEHPGRPVVLDLHPDLVFRPIASDLDTAPPLPDLNTITDQDASLEEWLLPRCLVSGDIAFRPSLELNK